MARPQLIAQERLNIHSVEEINRLWSDWRTKHRSEFRFGQYIYVATSHAFSEPCHQLYDETNDQLVYDWLAYEASWIPVPVEILITRG